MITPMVRKKALGAQAATTGVDARAFAEGEQEVSE